MTGQVAQNGEEDVDQTGPHSQLAHVNEATKHEAHRSQEHPVTMAAAAG